MIIKRSLPFASLVLLMTLYNRLDPVMLGKLLPDKAVAPNNAINTAPFQVGIYANGFRLLDAANMIAYLFSVLLIPVFSQDDQKERISGENGKTVIHPSDNNSSHRCIRLYLLQQ